MPWTTWPWLLRVITDQIERVVATFRFESPLLPQRGLELCSHIAALSKVRKRKVYFTRNLGVPERQDPCLHYYGAGGGNRTLMGQAPRDFEPSERAPATS